MPVITRVRRPRIYRNCRLSYSIQSAGSSENRNPSRRVQVIGVRDGRGAFPDPVTGLVGVVELGAVNEHPGGVVPHRLPGDGWAAQQVGGHLLGDTVVPGHLHAEKAVLKAMLQSKDAIADIVEVLGGHDFYRSDHSLIYTTILDLYGSGHGTDTLSVATHLEKHVRLEEIGGADYLSALVAGPSASRSWMAEAERVQSAAMLRRTKNAAIHIENLASDAELEAADRIADQAQAEMYAATTRRQLLPPASPLGDVMEDILDWIEATGGREATLPGVPTGFTDLDALTGGLHPGQFIVIAAHSDRGHLHPQPRALNSAPTRSRSSTTCATPEPSRTTPISSSSCTAKTPTRRTHPVSARPI